MTKKFLSIILSICMLLSLMPSAAFADEGPSNVVTLDIAKGPITITATGYKAEGAAAETSYTGSYIITGTSTAPINNLTIAGQSTGSAITLNDLDITTAGPEALSIEGGSPINVAIGEQGVKLSNTGVGIYIKDNTPFSMNGTGDLTVITGAPALQGSGNLFSVETEGNILFDGMGLLYGMGDISLISSGGNVSVAGRGAPSILCNNVNIKAKNNIDISNTNLFCISTAGSCALESTGGKISVATQEGNAPTVSCGKDINIKAKNDIDLSGAKSICLSSGNNIVVESTEGGVSVATKEVCGSPTISAKGSVTIKAKNDIDVSSAESLCLNSQSNIAVESTEGGVSMVTKEAMGSPTIAATQGAVIINAKNDILVSNKNGLCITGNSEKDVKFNSAAGSIKVTTEATVNPAIANCKNITVTAPVGGAAISNNALNNGAPVAACGSFSVTEGTVCSLSGGVDNMFSSIANDGSKDRIIATLTTPLYFSAPINPNGYGYNWDAASKTLTLNNLSIVTDKGRSAITVPDGTTVILNNTNNIISTSSGGGGIEAIGSLNIEGNGTLNIKAYGGITSNGGKITFSGGTVNLDCNLAAIAVTYQNLNNIDAIPQNIVLDTDKVYVKTGGSLVSSAWVKPEGSKKYIACNTFSEGGFVFNPPIITGVSTKVVIAQISCINISDVSGVTVPIKNGSPVKNITETSQYTGTVTWAPADTNFVLDTAYTATIKLMPKSGYTLKGVAENFFKVSGATCTNIADSGIITAVFPKTPNGGSSSGGGGSITPTPTVPAAKPENSADATTVKLGTTISGGTATGIITESDAKNIIENALKNNSDKIVIKPSVEGEPQKVAVEIPKTAVSDLSGKTDSKLVVATPIAEINISSEGLADIAAATGSKVTISAEMKNDSIVVEIKSDHKVANNVKGGISISIPAEKITAGTVAVLVKEDGTTEIIKKSAAKDGNIIVPLNGSATIKIIDNKKIFDDIKSEDWYSNAAAFVSSRELFGGTGKNSFGPDGSMTRGMLVTVLHRLENKPTGGNYSFLDVEPGAYYADAVSWASANSIVSGNGQSFMPNDNITREQLAVILYNYSKINGYDTTQGGMAIREFRDFNKISPWASEAMGWANASGLMSGRGNNTLDPSGTATRAEVAAMLERFIEMTTE